MSGLLAAGADVALVNERVFDAWVPVPVGSTPLHLAVMRNNAAIALQLLQHYVSAGCCAPCMHAPPRGRAPAAVARREQSVTR